MTDTALPAAARDDLDAGLAALGLEAALAEPLARYLALLLRWNATYNLTAIRDPHEMLVKHLLDSLAMHAHLDGIASLADLGTGPGLPGIPLAIARPQLRVTLVESNGKKARFLREAARQLKLGNIEVAESRIEAFAAPGRFDAITARALATLPLILALGGHLLAPGGRLLYCTCSVFRQEGAERIEAFAARNSDVLRCPAPGHLLPGRDGLGGRVGDNGACDDDGFFYALLQKSPA